MSTVIDGLTDRQRVFIEEFIATGNGQQAAEKAGYSKKTASAQASRLLKNVKIASEIRKHTEARERSTIMTAQEVMEYFTAVARGEIKDQFGLDAPLSERTRAAQEIAKRTIDIDNRLAGKEDATVTIKLDWSREE